jgi:hypothetical protein
MDNILIPPANDLNYDQDQLSDARDLLDDNSILVTPATLAAAAFLLSEQY